MIVYKITNCLNGKIYVGQTTGPLTKRWKEHCSGRTVSAISAAIKKYGQNNFEIKPIVKADSIDELNHRESYCIYKFDCLAPKGYNLRSGGKNSRLSEITKQKIAHANLGKKASEETKTKMAESQRKRPKRVISQQEKESRVIKERERCRNKKPKKKVEGWINPQIGKSITQNSILKNALSHGAKPFIVKSKEGHIVWQGLVMAQCAKELQLSVGNISQCLAGKRRQHKGFTFEVIDGQSN